MSGWRELLEMEFLVRIPTAKERDVIGEITGDDWAADLQQIAEYFPELLSDAGRKFIADDDATARETWGEINDAQDRENKMGRYSPVIEVEDVYGTATRNAAGSITDRQLAYLRRLGVSSQDGMLRKLSKKEASSLIDQVLQLREQNGLPV